MQLRIRILPLLSTIVPLLCCLTAPAIADGTFRSRPDLSPPHLNITIECSGRCENGFIFVAPFVGYADLSDHGPLQSAAYILTDSGDLVWSGFTYFSVWTANFQIGRWKGQDVLFAFEGSHNGVHGHGHGHHTILNQHYQTIRELRAGNHLLSDKHEFIILNEKTALIQIHHPLQANLASYGGTDYQTWIVDGRFQELDIETGDVIFEWHSLDHVSPHESSLPLPLGQAGDANNSSMAWDYFHTNSITKDDDGHYLLSARHTSTIYKINGTDGTIIWRLGGKHSDFELGPNVTFGFQHHARYLKHDTSSQEVISLFDNSLHGSEAAGGGDKEVDLYPFSRGKYIRLNHESKTATLERVFHPPNNSIRSYSQGSLQTLPNANVLIGWGSEGQITEYLPGGEIIFHAFIDGGFLQDKIQNYRAFRYNWTGFSPEMIAVFAEAIDSPPATNVYVSWNGDTETVIWRYVWTEQTTAGLTTKSKDVTRTGFETTLKLPGPPAAIGAIHVEAVGSDGRVLAISQNIRAVSAYWRIPTSDKVMPPKESREGGMSIDEL